VALLATGAATVAWSGAARADVVYRVYHTGGVGLSVRSGPTTSSARIGTVPEGASISIHCQTYGDNINGSTIWDQLSSGGFVTDWYVNTPSIGAFSPGIGQCGQASSPPPPPPQSVYNRGAAVNWALSHARDIRAGDVAFPDDCTWFVSQALWAGSLPKTAQWTNQGHHGKHGVIPGTVSATSARDLINYLGTSNNPVSITKYPLGPDRFRNNAVPEAQPGDIIAYQWSRADGGITHLSLVVDIAAGSYPEVSEWGTWFPQEPYVKRGWTWSQLNHEWLQAKYPEVTAILIHFNSR